MKRRASGPCESGEGGAGVAGRYGSAAPRIRQRALANRIRGDDSKPLVEGRASLCEYKREPEGDIVWGCLVEPIVNHAPHGMT